jgi:hypothetical protein
LREELGLPLKVAISHDVNGLPWPVVSLLREAGVELLLMGVNIVFGGHPLTRPKTFRWAGPDGTELLTFNTEHYNAFGRETHFHRRDTGLMARGLEAFLKRKLPADWPYDFAFLTATHPQFADNNPPVPLLLEMIRRWNEEGREPRLRLVQPEDLLDRIAVTRDQLPVHAGDWTDFWNFGCGCSAVETAINRGNHETLQAARILELNPHDRSDANRPILEEAETQALLWNEHTWTASRSLAAGVSRELTAQWTHKAALAWIGHSLSRFALRESLDGIARSDRCHGQARGLLLYNPSPFSRRESVRLPGVVASCFSTEAANTGEQASLEGEARGGRRYWDHLESRQHQLDQLNRAPDPLARWTPPFEVPAYALRWIPGEALQDALSGVKELDPAVGRAALNGLEMSWDPATGQILSLGVSGEAPVLEAGKYPVFGYVHERPEGVDEASPYRGRERLYDFDWDAIHADICGWQRDWQPVHEQAGRLLGLSLEEDAEGIRLSIRREAPGIQGLEQRVTLRRDRPAVTCEARFEMGPTVTPESVYFVFPTRFGSDWSAHFDTAGVPVELEREQLPGANLDFVTVDRWICLSDRERALVLSCPDAPLVQVGDFAFGRRRGTIPRDPSPLLAGWVTNNYWMTNFRPSQPGGVEVRYELSFADAYDPVACSRAASGVSRALEWHPVPGDCREQTRELIRVSPESVRLLDIRECSDGWELLLLNESGESAEAVIEFGDGTILAGREPIRVSLGGRSFRRLRIGRAV